MTIIRLILSSKVTFVFRNWPTAENKERKRKEAAERRARGDVLDNRYFGYDC